MCGARRRCCALAVAGPKDRGRDRWWATGRFGRGGRADPRLALWVETSLGTMALDLDDAIYGIAMCLFATIPCESLARPPTALTASRALPTVAFVLLMVLQLRKQYALGIIMVALNLSLRCADNARSLVAAPRPRRPAPLRGGDRLL